MTIETTRAYAASAPVQVPLCAGTVDGEEIIIQIEAGSPAAVMSAAIAMHIRDFSSLAAEIVAGDWIPAQGAAHLRLNPAAGVGVTIGTTAAGSGTGGTLTQPSDGKRVVDLIAAALADPLFIITLGAALRDRINELAATDTAEGS